MRDKVAKGRQPRGSQVPAAKLNEEIAAQILIEFSSGNSSAWDLARRHGVTESTMRSLLNGETWRHVDGPRLPRAEIIAIGKRNRASARAAARLSRGT